MKIFIKLFLCFIFLILLIKSSMEQGQILNKNFVLIQKDDSPGKIISKAARIIPTNPQYNWQKNEFIAFLHFGINTFTNREWGDGKENPGIFNPTNLNVEQWIKTLKDAGVKLVILTAKHHDGFCLWQSKYTDHSIAGSPYKNGKGDIVKEFTDACRKFGLKAGIYLSPWDRNLPAYGDSPKYNEIFRNQLRELLTDYGEISEVWFDGANGEGPSGKKQVYDWASYYKVVRELQPNAVIFGMAPDVRWVGNENGFARETEWSVVPFNINGLNEKNAAVRKYPIDQIYIPGDLTGVDLGSREKILNAKGLMWYPAESDVSIRAGWFYHPEEDDKVKTPQQLVNIYFNSVGRNSVLLLNVPPDKRGLINENDIKSLKGMKEIIDKTFEKDLTKDAGIKTDMELINPENNSGSYWINKNGKETAEMEFTLAKKAAFDVMMLQEEILVGQRIEKFHFDYWTGDEWKKLTEGTTVGYKRLLRFPPVKTDRVRLVIEKSRLNPTISNFGLFKFAERNYSKSIE